MQAYVQHAVNVCSCKDLFHPEFFFQASQVFNNITNIILHSHLPVSLIFFWFCSGGQLMMFWRWMWFSGLDHAPVKMLLSNSILIWFIFIFRHTFEFWTAIWDLELSFPFFFLTAEIFLGLAVSYLFQLLSIQCLCHF